MAMPRSIVVGIVITFLMFLIILIVILIACKPWRFFLTSARSRTNIIKVDDLERPLVSDGVDIHEENNELTRNYDLEGACYQNEGLLRSPQTHGLVYKQRLPSASPHLAQGDSLVLDVVSDPSDDISVGETLRCSSVNERLTQVQIQARKEIQSHKLNFAVDDVVPQEFVPIVIADQRSCLALEVISGPSRGLHCSVQSSNDTKLPLTLGRISGDLLLKDSEVSGKHAMINWNVDVIAGTKSKKKWELVDMGSLNGTLLNSQPINHQNSESRHWGAPVELSTGDIITLGTTSRVHVQVTPKTESQIPFGVGMASDPMAFRRGGKKLHMEDVCCYQWPLSGSDQFGVFIICDGHGGVAAANSASKMLPEKIASILFDPETRKRVLSQCDASDVLRVAISQTEASMNNYYEGCTATVLLVWAYGESFFAQCANLGDSACIMSVDGKKIKMTEDHRVGSDSERLRISEMGEPLKEGETRLCGLNLARMLGDKFLKQQDARFSSEPYISQAVHIDQANSAFTLLASDGFWDVIGVKKAFQLVLEGRDKYSTDGDNSTEKIANFLLSEARTLRTKDNTSILLLDFDRKSRLSSCKVDS